MGETQALLPRGYSKEKVFLHSVYPLVEAPVECGGGGTGSRPAVDLAE